MRSLLCTTGLAVFVLLASLEAAPGADEPNSRDSWDRYTVLVERNIFRRDRRVPSEPTGPVARPAPPNPERSVVFRGVVRQGDEYVAFLEDLRTGATTKARVGDPVVRGRLKEVSLDHIEYELDGQAARVEIGSSLEPGPSRYLPSAGLEGDDGAPQDVQAGGEIEPPAADTGGAGDIVEQLRLRRQRELGR